MSRKLELLANFLIVITCVAFLAVQGQKYFASRQSGPGGLSAGDSLHVPGVAWDSKKMTVVLALQTTCHFCSESAPFYRRLAKEIAAKQEIGMVAVFPQAAKEANQYLQGLEVAVPQVLQSAQMKVQGTPTLVLVDSKGKIRKSWLGKLQPSAEEEVIQSLALQ